MTVFLVAVASRVLQNQHELLEVQVQKTQYSLDGNGRMRVEYTFEGRPTVHAQLSGPKAVLAQKHQFAIKEMEAARSYLEHSLEILDEVLARPVVLFDANGPVHQPVTPSSKEQELLRALFAAATISYGKLFMGTGPGRKQFNPRDFYTGEGRRFAKLDAWWMAVRHEYIAHSASDVYDDAQVVMLFDVVSFEPVQRFLRVFPHVKFKTTPPRKVIADLREMVVFVYDFLCAKQQTLIDNIARNITLNMKAELRAAAVRSSPVSEWPPAPSITDLT